MNDVSIISYNEDEIIETTEFSTNLTLKTKGKYINWIDFNGIKDIESIEKIGKAIGIHHLIIEDVLNTNQMVKMDNYDDCLFLVLKMLKYDDNSLNITAEHISIVLKDNILISFHEASEDIFDNIKIKLRTERDHVRKSDIGYLCYELIDTVVDNYFEVIDELGDVTDNIEEELIANPKKNTLQRIYFVKKELMYLRKSVFPLRELIGKLSRSESKQINDDVIIYLRDVYDHLIQVVDSIETYQDILSNMLDTYLSSISNRTNDTMKILTIISTIFIPLTFIAGIYGMNFANIPELHYQYGYLIFWIVSIIIVITMVMFFHRKKWF
jgi:magnesium transporter